MRWVPNPARPPHRCAFMPTLAGFADKGFVEGTELFGGDFAYISIEAVEQIARSMGWAPAGLDVKASRISQLEQTVADRDARIAELEAQVDAVETLKRMGYQPKRAPGRPRKEVAA